MNDEESGASVPSRPPSGQGRGRALFPSWMKIDEGTLATLPRPTPRPPTPPPETKPKRRSHKKGKSLILSVPEHQPQPQRPPPPTDQLGYEGFQEEHAFPRGEEYDPPEPREEPSASRPFMSSIDGITRMLNMGDSDEFQIIPQEEAKTMKKNKAQQQQQKKKTNSAFRYGHIPEINQPILIDVAKLGQKKYENTGIFIPPPKTLDLWTVPAMRNQLAKEKILGIAYDERTGMPKERTRERLGYGKEDIVNWYKASQERMRTEAQDGRGCCRYRIRTKHHRFSFLPALCLQQDPVSPPTNTDPDTITISPTSTTPEPLTYEICEDWFRALNGARGKKKGDNCTMDLEANIKLYVDLVHPYKSEQNSKFMEYLFNTMTIASVTEEQLKAYWKQENNMTHCDLTNGLFCIDEICRDCRDDEELKKKYEV
jgi:hypothetical protein